MKRKTKLALGALVAIPVTLAVGEIVSRYWLGLGDPPLTIPDPDVEYRFAPGVYHRFGNVVTINQFSMRSAPVAPRKRNDGELRVLMLGDSIINGGALTDDSKIASTLLEAELVERFRIPIRVLNASAGSWGPPNEAAYLRRFGWFEADVLVLVLNSGDLGDVPEFSLGSNDAANFPTRKPASALVEGIERYSPIGSWFQTAPAGLVPPGGFETSEKISHEQVAEAIAEIFDGAKARGVPAIVIPYLTREELDTEAGTRFVAQVETWAKPTGANVVPVREAYRASLATGKDPYRSPVDLHPNAIGQRLIADALRAPLEKLLSAGLPATKPAQ